MSELDRIHFVSGAEQLLAKDRGVAAALHAVATKARSSAAVPADQRLSVIAGVSRRGAFAQLVMTGPRAIFVEFGTRKQRALAPLRNAIFGRRF